MTKERNELHREYNRLYHAMQWLERGMFESLGTGKWYEVACDTHKHNDSLLDGVITQIFLMRRFISLKIMDYFVVELCLMQNIFL